MVKLLNLSLFTLMLGLSGLTAFAQDPAPKEDDDDSSEQVEQREDSYRRQMELEDARSRDRTYIDSTYSPTVKQEKIDKLPEESRDNIRDQLVDIIMENGEWEPSDALETYPYAPTAAAQADAELKEQEQEAWDEQVEKYHEREAAAFGSYRGPVPGPGNPDGQEGGEQGEGAQEGQQGGSQGEGQGSQGASGGGTEKESGSAGSYQPYQAGSSSSEDEVSTAGVSESALDFLRGGSAQSQQAEQGSQAQPTSQAETETEAENNPEQSAAEYLAAEATPESPQDESTQTMDQPAQQNPDQAPSEQQQDASADVPIELRGVIAIEDLNKLEGTEIPVEPEDP